MAPRSRSGSLETAWRALAGNGQDQGWRTIPIDAGPRCQVLAARRFPGNEEAVLVGFKSVRLPAEPLMPRGKGFVVSTAQLERQGDGFAWLSLERRPAASFELFAMMAGDVIGVLDTEFDRSDSELLALFLARIKAWQDFMERSGIGLLNPEEEVGLFGELVMLQRLLESGVAADLAVKAWEGPMGGLQDFAIGQGAIEVKATVAVSGFPAIVFSLDQLDWTKKQPLFLAGVRLQQVPSGETLPELVQKVRDSIGAERASYINFNNRLVQAGYLDALSASYVRRFSHVNTRVVQIDDNSPVLTRNNVGPAISKARYELDLDVLIAQEITLATILLQLGVSDGTV